jgi:2-polyprenyl-6-hydroxyphenyl methylase/3-demethylubiquinone-9 3-methyltransferase
MSHISTQEQHQADDSNIDAAEIAKFEALASRWWDRQGDFKPLHDINPLRINWIDERAQLHGKKVADIGCGGGILAESMAQRGAQVTGIDMGTAPLNVARLHSLESGVDIDYRQLTAEQLAAQESGQYDVVTCLEMLEHVPNPSSVIKACAQLLQPGGQAFFSTINRNPKSWLMAIVGAEYILRLLPIGTHDHRKFLRPSELHSWQRKVGLVPLEITGMTYNPINDTYKLKPKNISVNYLMYTRKQQG